MVLNAIEQLTKEYAEAYALLEDYVKELQREIAAVKARKANKLKKLISTTAEAEAVLRAMLDDSPECFKKPKTHIFHGVKVGYKKQKGALSWQSVNAVIARIRKFFPDQEEILIRTTYTPDKDTLGKLEVKDLKKLGVNVKDAGDIPVIKLIENDMEKTVKALIKEAVGEGK